MESIIERITVDIYLPSVPIKTLRNWLHAELNAYRTQEI